MYRILALTLTFALAGCNTTTSQVDFKTEAQNINNYVFKAFNSKDYINTYKSRTDYDSVKWGGGYYAGAGCPKKLAGYIGPKAGQDESTNEYWVTECLGFWNAAMLNKLNYEHYDYTKEYGRELLLGFANDDSFHNNVVNKGSWILPPSRNMSWVYRTGITQLATGLYYMNSELEFTPDELTLIKGWFDRRFNEIYVFKHPSTGRACATQYGATKGQLPDQCNNTAAQVANGAAMIGVYYKDPVYIDRSVRIIKGIMEGTIDGVALWDSARGGNAPHYVANHAGYLVHAREVLLNAGVDIYTFKNSKGYSIIDMVNNAINTLLDPSTNYANARKMWGARNKPEDVKLKMTPHQYLYIMKPFVMKFRPELSDYVAKPADHHITVHVPVYMDYYVK